MNHTPICQAIAAQFQNVTLTVERIVPNAVDRSFNLHVGDLKGVHMEDGRGAWKRGDGCDVLKLADSPKRGARASVLLRPQRHREGLSAFGAGQARAALGWGESAGAN